MSFNDQVDNVVHAINQLNAPSLEVDQDEVQAAQDKIGRALRKVFNGLLAVDTNDDSTETGGAQEK